jgi:hypothetical protein
MQVRLWSKKSYHWRHVKEREYKVVRVQAEGIGKDYGDGEENLGFPTNFQTAQKFIICQVNIPTPPQGAGLRQTSSDRRGCLCHM